MPLSSSSHRPAAIVFLVALAALVALALASAWNCDDAFIAFRYSRNLAEGHGLCFNIGVEPPVEGYTQLLWVLLVAVIEWLELDVVTSARVLEIGGSAGLLALLVWCARVRMRLGVIGTAVAATFLVTSPTVVIWSTGGLGTAFFALAILLTADRLLGDRSESDETHRLPSVLAVSGAAILVTLARFDGVYWLAVLYGIAVLRSMLERDRAYFMRVATSAVVVLVAFGAQTLWRVAYHGDWLPNTARAKAGSSWQYLDRGFEYLATYWLAIPATACVLVVAGVLYLRRRGDWWLATCVLVSAATFLYGVLVGGDFMPMGRFYLPAIPFLALLAGKLVEELARTRGNVAAAAASALLLVGSVPALLDVSLAPRALREAVQFRHGREYESEYAFWLGEQERCARWTEVGRALALYTDPGDSIVRTSIGAIGYYSRRFIHDQYGLVSREVALEVDPDPNRATLPGHDVLAEADFFERFAPTYRYVALRFGVRPGTPEWEQLSIEPGSKGTRELRVVHASDGFAEDGALILVHF